MCINNKSNGSIHTLARARVKWLKQDTGSPLSRFRSTKESERSVLMHVNHSVENEISLR